MDSISKRKRVRKQSHEEEVESNASKRHLFNMWWFFYCAEDKQTFELNFNHSSWPKHFTALDKLALLPKERVIITDRGIEYNCQFCGRLDNVKSLREVRLKALEILENAENTLDEIDMNESMFLPPTQAEDEKSNKKPRKESSDQSLASNEKETVLPILTSVQNKVAPEKKACLKTSVCENNPLPNNSTSEVATLQSIVVGHQVAVQKLFKEHQDSNSHLLLELRKNRHEMAKMIKAIHIAFRPEHEVPDGTDEFVDVNIDFVKPPFMFNGIDLAGVEVLADPSAFGKVLARKMFGVKEKCQLIDRILDPDPTKAVNRQPVDAETAELFKNVALWAYRGEGLTRALQCYNIVKESANQYGRDAKRESLKPVKPAD